MCVRCLAGFGLTAPESVGRRCAQLRGSEQTSRSGHVWSTEHWPSGCKLPARPCSRPNVAAWCVCGYPPRAGVVCAGCCTSLLYGLTGAGINPAGSAGPPPGWRIGLIMVGGALVPAVPRLDRSADLRWSPPKGLLPVALGAGHPHYAHSQGFSSGCRQSSLPARTTRFAV